MILESIPASSGVRSLAGASTSPSMVDSFGRRIEYLRISVTDKCNLRCVYCMPMEGLPWLKRDEILDYEEIARVVRVMATMGLKRLRITGGEPLVRRDLSSLIRMLSAIDGIENIALSTNAVLLEAQAEDLKAAGVDRVNISLDSLREDRADTIARRPGTLAKVMRGLAAAEAVGFEPIKLNVVLMRDSNDDEIADLAAITRERPWHIRFIEIMPTGSNTDLSAESFISCNEALDRVRALGELKPVAGPAGQWSRDLLPLRRRARHHRRHHPDEPQLLRPLQPHAAHRGRPVAPLPVRVDPDRPAQRPAPGRRHQADRRGDPAHQARAPLAGAGQHGGLGRSDRAEPDGRVVTP